MVIIRCGLRAKSFAARTQQAKQALLLDLVLLLLNNDGLAGNTVFTTAAPLNPI